MPINSLPGLSLENKFDKLSKFLANLTQTKFEQRNAIRYKFVFDHNFDPVFLKEPTCCSQCSDFIYNPFAQKCKICKFTCHPKCLHLVNTRCLNSKKNVHYFEETFFLTPTFCKHCGSSIKGLPAQGLKCNSNSGGCGLILHKDCKDLTRKCCIKKNLACNGRKSGRVSIEDFDLLGILGEGKTGKVYLAKLKNGTKRYAIKTMKKNNENVVMDPESPLTEAKALKQGADFPFLTKLHCCFQTNTRLFLVMEFVSGHDLAYHLRSNDLPVKLTENRARFYAAEVALALFYLHSMNFIYRDLKPENIMIDNEGHCKLLDFGLAKELSEDYLMARTICGTPAYMSPEVIKEQEYSFAVDWWAFGVLIFEMLTGFLPFEGDNWDELSKNIKRKEVNLLKYIHNHEARDLLMGLLTKDPKRRIGTSSEQDIFDHSFFSCFDWQDIAGKRLKPPTINPKVNDDLMTFDEQLSMTPDTADQQEALVQDEFAGFSYCSQSFCPPFNGE